MQTNGGLVHENHLFRQCHNSGEDIQNNDEHGLNTC